ncbi:MAG: alpha/beta hydrolase-fold protein [Chloroflexota bacterium]
MLNSYPPATLFGTHVRKLTSSIVGQEYEILVWLPPGYAESEAAYPVVYMLDASLSFGMTVCATLPLIWGDDVPAFIIVGIGYTAHSFDDIGGYRDRDFTPSALADVPEAGGADKFLAFIETELTPFVNSNYRVDPLNQNIWGYSLAGVFVLYALLQKPSLFRGVIAGSPSLRWAKSVIFPLEEKFSESHTALPVYLFLSIGSEEGEVVEVVETFSRILASRNYDGLLLRAEVFSNEGHTSSVARSYVSGLRTIFKA